MMETVLGKYSLQQNHNGVGEPSLDLKGSDI